MIGSTVVAMAVTAGMVTGPAAQAGRLARRVAFLAASSAGRQRAAASFIAPMSGWVLEAPVPSAHTCGGCLELARTRDGGSGWTVVSKPPARFTWSGTGASGEERVSKVAFANRSDGYLYGPGLLLSDDGGRAWSVPTVRSATSLVIADGRVLVLTTPTRATTELWSAPVGGNRWTELPLPGTARVSELVADGHTVLALHPGNTSAEPRAGDLGRLWVSSDGGGSWRRGRLPCTVHDGGAAMVAIELGKPQRWLVDCYDNLQSSQQLETRHHLYLTSDAGGRWSRLADAAQRGEPLALAANGAGQMLLATQSAQDALFATFDDGRRWRQALDDGGDSTASTARALSRGASPTSLLPRTTPRRTCT